MVPSRTKGCDVAWLVPNTILLHYSPSFHVRGLDYQTLKPLCPPQVHILTCNNLNVYNIQKRCPPSFFGGNGNSKQLLVDVCQIDHLEHTSNSSPYIVSTLRFMVISERMHHTPKRIQDFSAVLIYRLWNYCMYGVRVLNVKIWSC